MSIHQLFLLQESTKRSKEQQQDRTKQIAAEHQEFSNDYSLSLRKEKSYKSDNLDKVLLFP